MGSKWPHLMYYMVNLSKNMKKLINKITVIKGFEPGAAALKTVALTSAPVENEDQVSLYTRWRDVVMNRF